MSAAQEITRQPWHARRVMTCNGQPDTHLETGEDYQTIELVRLWSLEPVNKPKLNGPAFIPSEYCGHDARVFAVQREHGRYVTLAADLDKGDHPLAQVVELVETLAAGAAWLIYSSPHALPGDRRWRIVVPLADAVPYDIWHDAQTAFFDCLEAAGVCPDRALDRSAQLVFLPNVPARHVKTGVALRDGSGQPLYYDSAKSDENAPGLALGGGKIADALAALHARRAEDERLREKLRDEAMTRAANRRQGSDGSLIEAFNRDNALADLLAGYGYQQSPRRADDWRSPNQTGMTFATRIIGDKWVSLSSSDAALGLGGKCATGCYGDAYDLFVHYEHRGDHGAAFRVLGKERRDRDYQAPRGGDTFRAPVQRPDSADARPATGANGNALEFEWAGSVEPQLIGFWLIKKLLPAQGLALLYGHPGSGKTFLALDFGFHVAMGWYWQGKKVKQGLVVYVAAEGARGLRNRVAAFKAHHHIKPTDPFPLAIIPSPIDMQAADADTPRLAQTIREACSASGFDPALVVVDTISKTFGGGKENTDDMVTYVANCGRIASEFDCCVMPVHHRPKDAESQDPRGHSSLRGGSDTIIICEAGKPKKARVMKQKDGEEGDSYLFDLVPVELGVDEDGEAVTSCYVQPAMVDLNPAPDPRDKAAAKLSDGQRIALQHLGKAIAVHGHAAPADIPDHVINRFMVAKVVSIDAWRDMFLSANRTGIGQVGRADSREAGQASDKKPDTLARNFLRYKEKLQAIGIIGVWDGYAWIAHGKVPGAGQASDSHRTSSSPISDRSDTPSYKEGCPVRLGSEKKEGLSRVVFPADDDGLDANGDIIGWNDKPHGGNL